MMNAILHWGRPCRAYMHRPGTPFRRNPLAARWPGFGRHLQREAFELLLPHVAPAHACCLLQGGVGASTSEQRHQGLLSSAFCLLVRGLLVALRHVRWFNFSPSRGTLPGQKSLRLKAGNSSR